MLGVKNPFSYDVQSDRPQFNLSKDTSFIFRGHFPIKLQFFKVEFPYFIWTEEVPTTQLNTHDNALTFLLQNAFDTIMFMQ